MNRERMAGCVVMAAGNAERFGTNKLLHDFFGKPLICRTLDALPLTKLECVVVTQYPEIDRIASGYGLRSIRNEFPDFGVSHTILLGTEALLHCDGILYVVGDQPMLTRESISALVSTWNEHPDSIVCSSVCGQHRNPCMFPKKYFSELMSLKGDRGGNSVIRNHPDAVRLVEFREEELTDCDTAEALEALKALAADSI